MVLRLRLDVGIEGCNWELELDLMNTIVWMPVELELESQYREIETQLK
jgi:hypothetical protein